MLRKLIEACGNVKYKVNIGGIITSNRDAGDIYANYVCLGQISLQDRTSKELKARKEKAWRQGIGHSEKYLKM